MRLRLLQNAQWLLLMAAGIADEARGMGFAPAQPVVTLGAPLDFSVGIRLDAGEVLLPGCVAAEVTIGDNTVARAGVTTTVEIVGGRPVIRVRTVPRIVEPVVGVTVTAGCDARLSRRYQLFADPSGLAQSVPPVVNAEPVPPPLASADLVPGAAPSVVPRPPSPRIDASPGTPAARRETSRPGARARSSAGAAAPSPEHPGGSAAAVAPRLRLDAPRTRPSAQGGLPEATGRQEAELTAARIALADARSAADAASARAAAMERSLEALKKESQVQRESLSRLEKVLVAGADRDRWPAWLLAAVLALLAFAGWLYLRLRVAEAGRDRAWQSSAQLGARPGADDLGSEPPPSMPAPASAPIASERMSGPARADTSAPAVSVDELLDVEQQAEFFVVLGQEDAAIDLLTGHLPGAVGASPLPYLRLLDIHHRRGDAVSYDQIRRRFEERFGTRAPSWDDDPADGRGLDDDTAALARLQRAWPHPADAMAVLEELLARGGGAGFFGLPAYRDLLFLYMLARDLLETHPDGDRTVDVLLPLEPGAPTALELAPRESGRSG